MEYQLGLWETLEAMLVVRGSALGTMIFFVLYFVLPVIMYRIVPPQSFPRTVVIILFTGLWGISLLPTWGSGWKINDGLWNIKAYGFSDKVRISTMEIGYVTQEGEWETDIRQLGGNAPGLAEGQFRLKNKKKALVFNHFYQTKRLIIAAEGKYYLIGHPGIEKLYDLLLANGAKEKSFE